MTRMKFEESFIIDQKIGSCSIGTGLFALDMTD
ncbi:hypothetical protein SAMN05443246_0237 [Paenibacillus sp. GP183]|jgi:hypothetical protein|nr:hypothetical protein SAMN05443246_0237 [Paenibacillus sp. GP183]